MHKEVYFNHKEKEMAIKIENYFKSNDMNFRDKVFSALLIAEYDLEAYHFSNENQRLKILEYQNVLGGLLKKLS